MTIREAARALRDRKVSSVELTDAALARAERYSRLNSFITLMADSARRRALLADQELATGRDRGPLHGIPVAVKDLFYTRGVRTTDGSKLHENFVPQYDAAVVERLEASGAVMLGKLNQHELAYGITSANPHFGPVLNPWNMKHIPGGSSGGSGAAVAAGIAYMAMGSDTGGSIRIPASYCGTVGLKPTYGRVSRYGSFPLSWTFDHMGPLTRTVADAAVTLNAIAGHDPRDPGSSRRPTVDYVPEDGASIRGLRLGFPENFYFDRVDPDVEMAVRGAVARAQSLGAVVTPIRVPDIAAMNAVSRVLLLADVAALLTPHLARRDSFGADVLTLLDQGRLLPASEYVNAHRLRRQMQREFNAIWSKVDCLFTPCTPITAPACGAATVHVDGREEDVRLATTRLVRAINLLGLPALSVPCGLSASGMPIGLQIVGAAFEEATLLRVGAALEEAGVVIPPCPGQSN